jgi:hypothetical protein
MILRSGKTMARWLGNLPPYRFDQTEKLWLAAIVAGVIYVVLFAFVPGFENFGWPCIWKRSTGVECLGCGFTRACGAIVTAQWHRAWELHPLVFLIIPYFAWRLANIVVGIAAGRSLNAAIPWSVRKMVFWAGAALITTYIAIRIIRQLVNYA